MDEKISAAIRKTLLTVQNMRSELESLKSEPIAVVGMSCRFPAGANDPAAYWDLLVQGEDGISEVPAQRWNADDFYDPDVDAPGKMITKRGGFLNTDVSAFDATFFGISPREAEYLDPQQRLLLEVSYEALVSTGMPIASLKKSLTAVFIGICSHDYNDLLLATGDKTVINAYMATGNMASTASGRLSYVFGFQGPNFAIDTACSSSLVAIHEACKTLRTGEANLALAGGVNLILTPDLSIDFSKAGMLAPDGHCKTFDASANGYVRGEGCGVIVLKRLSDAQRDGNRVLAVIKGSGINQDGASSGLTVPNGAAQETLMRDVLAKAKLVGADIDYVEAHGTGTPLGDPIEVRAIGAVYGARDTQHVLRFGSVKTNIGHLEGAAGIASVIKVILALQHETLPGQLHFKTLNPQIDLNFPGEVASTNQAWPRSARIRRAAVSSFGFSGTNAHLILEEGPLLTPEEQGVLMVNPPFKMHSYWVKEAVVKARTVQKSVHPLLGVPFDLADGMMGFTSEGNAKEVHSEAHIIEMIVAAQQLRMGLNSRLTHIHLSPFTKVEQHSFSVQNLIKNVGEGLFQIQTYSRTVLKDGHEESWQLLASSDGVKELIPIDKAMEHYILPSEDLVNLKVDDFYAWLDRYSLNTTDSYTRLSRVFMNNGLIYAEIDTHLLVKGYFVHPRILQAVFDLIYLSIPVPETREGSGNQVHLVACDELVTLGRIAFIAKAKFQFKGLDESELYRADVYIYDENGNLALMLKGLGFKLVQNVSD